MAYSLTLSPLDLVSNCLHYTTHWRQSMDNVGHPGPGRIARTLPPPQAYLYI